MTDVLILALGAVTVMAGSLALALIVRRGQRRKAELRRDAPRRLRDDLRAADAYIEQVSRTLSEDDLDSLNRRFRNGDH